MGMERRTMTLGAGLQVRTSDAKDAGRMGESRGELCMSRAVVGCAAMRAV